MSVISQQYKQKSNCLGIRLETPQESRNSLLTKEDEQKTKENDAMLVEALNGLTFEERQEQQEIVHGVDEMTADESTFIESTLKDLDNILLRTKHGTLYETAESLNPEYVGARAFRIMFLRGNRYDAKASAKQMLTFFEWKEQLFGREKLVKDITMDDLDEDDRACMRAGYVQIPGKDRSNRTILLHLPGLRSFKTLMNELRSRYYIWMTILKSEECQLRGAVVLVYAVGCLKDQKEGVGYMENARLFLALPLHQAAIHVFTDNSAEYIMGNGIIRMFSSKIRARFRIHYGSHMECQYLLPSYGISPKLLPLKTITLQVNMHQHHRWCESCLLNDTSDCPDLGTSQTTMTKYNDDDVLYVAGKKSNNAGNERLRVLVADLSQKYDTGTTEKKRTIVEGMIGEIHKTGGRFLKQNPGSDSDWIEIPVDEARLKITQMFRNHRRRVGALIQGGCLIAGEPLPNDVVFGKTHRSRGSDLMHYLIKARSDEYNSLDRGMKVQVVDAVLERIKGEGGRFLQTAPEHGGWLEVTTEMARIRVSKYFRNNRRKAKKNG
ncbi:unnamed protein product [Cylindrotheca closterium]|uniref:DUF6824 domain-containing protein n=1 Tax=Cylindrotheca closterium TaxID=2856 RepID=A0AAD2GDF7_9STRA|nr:unnamed protein product [Cylindrotheca closterium]